jgi:hypothetical protein
LDTEERYKLLPLLGFEAALTEAGDVRASSTVPVGGPGYGVDPLSTIGRTWA